MLFLLLLFSYFYLFALPYYFTFALLHTLAWQNFAPNAEATYHMCLKSAQLLEGAVGDTLHPLPWQTPGHQGAALGLSWLGSVPQFESQYSGFKCLCQHGDEGDSRIKRRGQRRAGQGSAAQWFMPVQSVPVAAAEVLLCMNFRGASGSLQLPPKSIGETVLYFGITFMFNPIHLCLLRACSVCEWWTSFFWSTSWVMESSGYQ